MPRAPRVSRKSGRPRVPARTLSETAGSRPTEAPARPFDAGGTEVAAPSASQESAVLREAVFTEPPKQAAQRASPVNEEPRFQIFIVDGGWNSPAHKVLHENFGMLRKLARNDPIYVLSREKSIEFIYSH